MKKISVLCLFSILILMTGCKENRTPEIPAPLLEIINGETGFVVPSNGGTQSIEYSITNPVEGGIIEAIPAEDWINSINCDTENQIVFNVDPHTAQIDAPEARSQILTVTYTYGDGLVIKCDINIIQNGGIIYDYEWEMSELNCKWEGDYYSSQKYYLCISDLPWSEDKVKPGGTYYQFQIIGQKPEDEENPRIPAGTYTLGAEIAGYELWTFDPMFSTAFRYDEAGHVEWQANWTEGTVSISYEGDQMIVDCQLTDADGKTHHAAYRGAGTCIDARPEPYGIGRDISFTANYATAFYIVHFEDEYMEIGIQFTDMQLDSQNQMIPPGSFLNITATMAFDKYGYLQTGVYEMGTNEYPFVHPGMELLGMLGGTVGQYAVTNEEFYTTLITDGTMTVEGGWGNYTITCNFVCCDGYKFSCTYTGEIKTTGMPGNSSTLEGDYTLDLEKSQATGLYWGDFYDNTTGNLTGMNWFIQFNSVDGSDGFMADFVSGLADPEKGIPTGTYTAAESIDLAPWRYLKGQVVDGQLIGTAYMGDFNENGNATSYAPAVSGDLNITNNGDGTYHIQFEFLDDKGNTWDGDWTGSFTELSTSSASQHRDNYVELPSNVLSDVEKVEIMHRNMPLKLKQ